jgi:hypothetical protein
MSTVNITTSNNIVSAINANQSVSIIDNSKNTIVSISQSITDVVQVATQGPQGPTGPQGPQGPVGSIFPYTGSAAITGSLTVTGSVRATSFTGSLQWNNLIDIPVFATTGSNTFNGTQTINSNLIISEGSKVYINGGAIPSPGISSYSDPITQLTTQGDYSGETIKGVAGEGLEPGQLIYLYTDGLWYKANASPDNTNGNPSATSLLGIIITGNPVNTNDNIVVLLQGNVYTNQITGGEAPGSPLWIDITAGSVRNSKPNSTNNIVRQVGHVLTTHVLRFNPDNYYSIV